MEEKSSSCWRLIRAIPERTRLPARRCALLQEEVHVEPRVAIGAAPSSAPNADEHLRPSLVAFRPQNGSPVSSSTGPALPQSPARLLTATPRTGRLRADRATVEVRSLQARRVPPCAALHCTAERHGLPGHLGHGSGRPRRWREPHATSSGPDW